MRSPVVLGVRVPVGGGYLILSPSPRSPEGPGEKHTVLELLSLWHTLREDDVQHTSGCGDRV